jgi:uncharacterized glyoxalase superfamily protein PhnB
MHTTGGDMELGRFRVGLRVEDVAAAAVFYRGLGSTDVGSVPGPDGRPVMTMLQRDGAMLIVDALEGMPFPDSERERRTRIGPRGLGVVIGLGVDDLGATYAYCVEAGCQITAEPADAPWGDRVFGAIDPFGYAWEVSQPTTKDVADPLLATREEWFGS